MLIGKNFATNKIYRGIKHYDGLPLLSEDIHESMDTLSMKAAYFTENLVGSGTLNTPGCQIAADGIYLTEPSAVLIKGDIALIQSDKGPIVSPLTLYNAKINEALICAVGWYQEIGSNSNIYAYGGLENTILENDLLNQDLGMQVSSRYQFVWDISVFSELHYEEEFYTSIDLRDSKGVKTGTRISLRIPASTERVREVGAPSAMSYAASNIYIIPILSCKYDISTARILSAEAVTPISIANNIANLPVEETIIHTVTSARQGDITIYPEFSSSIREGNLIEVLHNGILLSENYHYKIDYQNNAVILINTSTELYDEITFIKKDTKGRPSGGSGVSTYYDESTGNLVIASLYDETTGNLII